MTIENPLDEHPQVRARGRASRSPLAQAARQIGKGGTKFMGYTSSAVAPAVANYPENRSWGFHRDTAGAVDYLAFNEGGTILMWQLSTTGVIANPLPVANGGTGDTGTAWTTYTPTLTAGTGAFTSATATGAYKKIGKTVFVRIVVSITTNGTAASYVGVTLPFAAIAVNTTTLAGVDNGVTGKSLVVAHQTATDIRIRFYDTTYPGANNAILILDGVYEAA